MAKSSSPRLVPSFFEPGHRAATLAIFFAFGGVMWLSRPENPRPLPFLYQLLFFGFVLGFFDCLYRWYTKIPKKETYIGTVGRWRAVIGLCFWMYFVVVTAGPHIMDLFGLEPFLPISGGRSNARRGGGLFGVLGIVVCWAALWQNVAAEKRGVSDDSDR